MRPSQSTLAAVAVAAALVLAGCGGQAGTGTPTDRTTTDAPQTTVPGPDLPPSADPASADTAFGRAFLEQAGPSLSVQSIAVGNESARVTYRAAANRSDRSQQALLIGMAFATTVNQTAGTNASAGVESIVATGVDADGRTLVQFAIPTTWAVALTNGNMTLAEYSDGIRARLRDRNGTATRGG
ncbi:MAG: hypothetical protein ABEJ31_04680 [Haloarculaceae archaeon]